MRSFGSKQTIVLLGSPQPVEGNINDATQNARDSSASHLTMKMLGNQQVTTCQHVETPQAQNLTEDEEKSEPRRAAPRASECEIASAQCLEVKTRAESVGTEKDSNGGGKLQGWALWFMVLLFGFEGLSLVILSAANAVSASIKGNVQAVFIFLPRCFIALLMPTLVGSLCRTSLESWRCAAQQARKARNAPECVKCERQDSTRGPAYWTVCLMSDVMWSRIMQSLLLIDEGDRRTILTGIKYATNGTLCVCVVISLGLIGHFGGAEKDGPAFLRAYQDQVCSGVAHVDKYGVIEYILLPVLLSSLVLASFLAFCLFLRFCPAPHSASAQCGESSRDHQPGARDEEKGFSSPAAAAGSARLRPCSSLEATTANKVKQVLIARGVSRQHVRQLLQDDEGAASQHSCKQLPRVPACCLAGACLGALGACWQQMLSVLGTRSGFAGGCVVSAAACSALLMRMMSRAAMCSHVSGAAWMAVYGVAAWLEALALAALLSGGWLARPCAHALISDVGMPLTRLMELDEEEYGEHGENHASRSASEAVEDITALVEGAQAGMCGGINGTDAQTLTQAPGSMQKQWHDSEAEYAGVKQAPKCARGNQASTGVRARQLVSGADDPEPFAAAAPVAPPPPATPTLSARKASPDSNLIRELLSPHQGADPSSPALQLPGNSMDDPCDKGAKAMHLRDVVEVVEEEEEACGNVGVLGEAAEVHQMSTSARRSRRGTGMRNMCQVGSSDEDSSGGTCTQSQLDNIVEERTAEDRSTGTPGTTESMACSPVDMIHEHIEDNIKEQGNEDVSTDVKEAEVREEDEGRCETAGTADEARGGAQRRCSTGAEASVTDETGVAASHGGNRLAAAQGRAWEDFGYRVQGGDGSEKRRGRPLDIGKPPPSPEPPSALRPWVKPRGPVTSFSKRTPPVTPEGSRQTGIFGAAVGAMVNISNSLSNASAKASPALPSETISKAAAQLSSMTSFTAASNDPMLQPSPEARGAGKPGAETQKKKEKIPGREEQCERSISKQGNEQHASGNKVKPSLFLSGPGAVDAATASSARVRRNSLDLWKEREATERQKDANAPKEANVRGVEGTNKLFQRRVLDVANDKNKETGGGAVHEEAKSTRKAEREKQLQDQRRELHAAARNKWEDEQRSKSEETGKQQQQQERDEMLSEVELARRRRFAQAQAALEESKTALALLCKVSPKQKGEEEEAHGFSASSAGGLLASKLDSVLDDASSAFLQGLGFHASDPQNETTPVKTSHDREATSNRGDRDKRPASPTKVALLSCEKPRRVISTGSPPPPISRRGSSSGSSATSNTSTPQPPQTPKPDARANSRQTPESSRVAGLGDVKLELCNVKAEEAQHQIQVNLHPWDSKGQAAVQGPPQPMLSLSRRSAPPPASPPHQPRPLSSAAAACSSKASMHSTMVETRSASATASSESEDAGTDTRFVRAIEQHQMRKQQQRVRAPLTPSSPSSASSPRDSAAPLNAIPKLDFSANIFAAGRASTLDSRYVAKLEHENDAVPEQKQDDRRLGTAVSSAQAAGDLTGCIRLKFSSSVVSPTPLAAASPQSPKAPRIKSSIAPAEMMHKTAAAGGQERPERPLLPPPRRKLVDLTDEQRLLWMAEVRRREELQEEEEQRGRIEREQVRRRKEDQEQTNARGRGIGGARLERVEVEDQGKGLESDPYGSLVGAPDAPEAPSTRRAQEEARDMHAVEGSRGAGRGTDRRINQAHAHSIESWSPAESPRTPSFQSSLLASSPTLLPTSLLASSPRWTANGDGGSLPSLRNSIDSAMRSASNYFDLRSGAESSLSVGGVASVAGAVAGNAGLRGSRGTQGGSGTITPRLACNLPKTPRSAGSDSVVAQDRQRCGKEVAEEDEGREVGAVGHQGGRVDMRGGKQSEGQDLNPHSQALTVSPSGVSHSSEDVGSWI